MKKSLQFWSTPFFLLLLWLLGRIIKPRWTYGDFSPARRSESAGISVEKGLGDDLHQLLDRDSPRHCRSWRSLAPTYPGSHTAATVPPKKTMSTPFMIALEISPNAHHNGFVRRTAGGPVNSLDRDRGSVILSSTRLYPTQTRRVVRPHPFFEQPDS
ncbi:MAG: hypothetical protein KatS3mg104_0540 [Phycisphaerae bacterium]|jgi:hypothetical protein|nr:MAG: hypothetical protein KatS3mg104_0540 [Phycisphaerae bacterium]